MPASQQLGKETEQWVRAEAVANDAIVAAGGLITQHHAAGWIIDHISSTRSARMAFRRYVRSNAPSTRSECSTLANY